MSTTDITRVENNHALSILQHGKLNINNESCLDE